MSPLGLTRVLREAERWCGALYLRRLWNPSPPRSNCKTPARATNKTRETQPERWRSRRVALRSFEFVCCVLWDKNAAENSMPTSIVLRKL